MKRPAEIDPAPKPDLTPMIDIVFNLIIFFMIVSELSNLTVEELELAYASEAQQPAEGREAGQTLQLNLLGEGRVAVGGALYRSDRTAARGPRSLALLLELEAAGKAREESLPGSLAPSTLQVNLRADRETPFREVQRALDHCQREGIYRTSLAASPDSPTR